MPSKESFMLMAWCMFCRTTGSRASALCPKFTVPWSESTLGGHADRCCSLTGSWRNIATSITMTSSWAWWCLKSPASRLFTQSFVQAQIKSKLHITGLCERNLPLTGEFPAQRVSNIENVSSWWRHHVRLWLARTLYSSILVVGWFHGAVNSCLVIHVHLSGLGLVSVHLFLNYSSRPKVNTK